MSFPVLLRALVFISHGAGEHSGRYDELAQRLKELSLLAFAHDHGESHALQYIILMHTHIYTYSPALPLCSSHGYKENLPPSSV